jgi:DedD protein
MLGNRKGSGQGPYYLTRSQLVLLSAGFTLVTVAIFFLGILVGTGIEERKLLKKEEPLVKIPVQPLLPGSKAGTPKEEMTFYDTLANAQTATKAKEGKPAEKGTKSEAKEGQATAKQVPPASAKDRTLSLSGVKKETQAEKLSGSQAAKTKSAREANWTVQVNAYPNERDAEALAKKLKDKGYDAYVASTNVKGRAWYRVRVGHLETREQAQDLQETLRQKENLSQSIATSR